MNKDLLNAAYQEWSAFLTSLTEEERKSTEAILDSVEMNNIHYYATTESYYSFDQTINRLPNKYLYDEEIIHTVFTTYLKRDLHELAFDYLIKASNFCKNNKLPIPLIIDSLKADFPDEGIINKIRYTLSNLPSQRITDIPSILPANLNGHLKLNDFILYELIQATRVMIDKIESIRDIKSENRFNDLLLAILRLRLPIWGWSIQDQSRVGKALGGKDAGEADHLIQAAGNNIALIEAFITRNKAYTEKHILKCKDYIDNLERFYIIIYYNKKRTNFNNSWEKYKNDVLNINYPSDFVINSKKGFIDLLQNFSDINHLKVSKTLHSKNIEVFHIMINLGL